MKPLEGTSQKQSLIAVSPPSKQDKKTIVVLGVERGGTSMVAGMIRALGIDLGEKAGRNHEDPKFLKDDQEALLAHINEYNAQKETWGFKVPKASLMLDFYDKHLRNPHYVLVFRNIGSTVDSWCSRGANDPMSAALHSMKYYDAVLNYLKDKNRPLAFANYERACENPMKFAADLAAFLGADTNLANIERAAALVTGEGGGYLDLPEYYFHIDSLLCNDFPAQSFSFDFDAQSDSHMAMSKKSIDQRIILKPEKEFFPKEFYLGFSLDSKSAALLHEQGLRVYMDFSGTFFPGHAFRPPIRNGRNLLRISNNGNVQRIALGPLKSSYTFALQDIQLFAKEEGDEAAYEILTAQPLPHPSLAQKVFRKLRASLC